MARKWRRALDAGLASKCSPDEVTAAIAAHAATPHGGNAAWADITGKPATFPPEAHNHDASYSAAGHAHAGTYEPANANIQAHVAAAHAPSNAQKNSDITKAEIEAKLTGEIASHTHAGGSLTLAQVYPVGCIYTSTVSTNPADVFGLGTWAAFGAGRCLVGLDSGQTEFDTVEETGGAKTVTLTAAQSGLPQHTHTQNAHTHTQDAHSHTYASQTATTGGVSSYEHGAIDTSSTAAESSISTNAATATNQNATAVNQNAGPTDAAQAHSNLQPYIVVYFFKRTA